MLIIMRILRAIKIKAFVRGIGSVAKEYEVLTQETERTALAMREFGMAWSDVIHEKRMREVRDDEKAKT